MILRFFFLFLLLSILTCNAVSAQEIKQLENWQFHQGDLVTDSKGRFEFEENEQVLWKPVKPAGKVNFGNGIYWIKVKLPEYYSEDMSLFFTTSGNSFEMYIDGEMIYDYGDIHNSKRNVTFIQHQVTLPEDSYNKLIYIRIHNDFSNLDSIARYTGYTNYLGKITIDTLVHRQEKLMIYWDDSEKYLGYVFLFLGIIAFILSIIVRTQTKVILYFCGLTLFAGLYLVTHTRFANGAIQYGVFTHYALTTILYLLPFFVCGFIKEYFQLKNKILSFFYWTLLLHAVLLFVLDILNLVPTPLFFNVFLLFALAAIVYTMSTLIKYAINGDNYAKLIITGFFLASIIWIYDLYQWIRTPEYFSTQPALSFQWGVFIFVLAIGFVIIYRYLDSNKRIIKMNKELLDVQENMVIALGELSEARSSETGEHIKRVAEISVKLAAKYGMSKDDLELIKLASPMHDIGKVAIPDYILNKPGRLSKEEFEIIKTHPRVGYDILIRSNQRILNKAAIIALQHHERYNGKGYPDGLKGNDIHIFARITAIADVFDALISDRVYKKAYSIPDALELIRIEKGEQFDPLLVDLFLEIAKELFPM